MINLNRLNKDFSYKVNLNPLETKYFSFKEDEETDDYAPFKNAIIFNIGDANLYAFINGSDKYKFIPAGAIAKFLDKDISNLKIVNASNSENALFYLNLNNDLTEIELLKAIYEVLINGK